MLQKENKSSKFYLESELMEVLKTLLPLHSVYVIGINKEKKNRTVFISPASVHKQKTISYTLLIIGYKPMSKGLGEFMDGIYNQMQKRCKVCVIYYTLAFSKCV